MVLPTEKKGSAEAAAERFQQSLLDGDAQAELAITSAYQGAWTGIVNQLEPIYRKIDQAQKAGTPVQPVWLFEANRLEELERQVRTEIETATGQSLEATKLAQYHVAQETVRSHRDILIGQGMSPSAGFTGIPEETLVQLAGQLGDGSTLRSEDFTSSSAVWEQVKGELMTGLLLGENSDVIAERIAKISGASKNRAVGLARTEIFNAQRRVAHASYQANADLVKSWTWLAALSPLTCAMCWAMHGTEHPLTEQMSSHVSCRCTSIPNLIDDEADEELKVPRGEDQFKYLSDADKERVLGRTKYLMYKSGKLKLSDLVGIEDNPRWGRSRRELTVQELRDKGFETPHRAQLRRDLTAYYSKEAPFTTTFKSSELGMGTDFIRRDGRWDVTAHGPEAKAWSQDQIFDRMKDDPEVQKLLPVIMKKQYSDKTPDAFLKDYIRQGVQSWAGTSADESTRSVRLQNAAEQEFGLKNVAHPWSPETQETSLWAKSELELDRIMLRRQYELTQEQFAAKGITHLTLVRGVSWNAFNDTYEPDWSKKWNPNKDPGFRDASRPGYIHLQPLSSYSSDPYTSQQFASGGAAYMLSTRIPVSQIHSSPNSGLGCLSEYEFVVMGGAGTHLVTPIRAFMDNLAPVGPDNRPIFDSDQYHYQGEGIPVAKPVDLTPPDVDTLVKDMGGHKLEVFVNASATPKEAAEFFELAGKYYSDVNTTANVPGHPYFEMKKKLLLKYDPDVKKAAEAEPEASAQGPAPAPPKVTPDELVAQYDDLDAAETVDILGTPEEYNTFVDLGTKHAGDPDFGTPGNPFFEFKKKMLMKYDAGIKAAYANQPTTQPLTQEGMELEIQKLLAKGWANDGMFTDALDKINEKDANTLYNAELQYFYDPKKHQIGHPYYELKKSFAVKYSMIPVPEGYINKPTLTIPEPPKPPSPTTTPTQQQKVVGQLTLSEANQLLKDLDDKHKIKTQGDMEFASPEYWVDKLKIIGATPDLPMKPFELEALATMNEFELMTPDLVHAISTKQYKMPTANPITPAKPKTDVPIQPPPETQALDLPLAKLPKYKTKASALKAKKKADALYYDLVNQVTDQGVLTHLAQKKKYADMTALSASYVKDNVAGYVQAVNTVKNALAQQTKTKAITPPKVTKATIEAPTPVQASPEAKVGPKGTPPKPPEGTKVQKPQDGDTMEVIQTKMKLLDALIAHKMISNAWYYKNKKAFDKFIADGKVKPTIETAPLPDTPKEAPKPTKVPEPPTYYPDFVGPVSPKYQEMVNTSGYTKTDLNVLEEYTTLTFKKANTFLREGGPISPKTEKFISDLDDIIDKNSLADEVTLYRGVDLSKMPAKYSSLKIGDTVTELGYTSTTLDVNTALDYATDFDAEKPAVFVMNVPAGTKYGLPDIARGSTDQELVLPQGTAYKVTNIEVEMDGTLVYYVDVKPKAGATTPKKAPNTTAALEFFSPAQMDKSVMPHAVVGVGAIDKVHAFPKTSLSGLPVYVTPMSGYKVQGVQTGGGIFVNPAGEIKYMEIDPDGSSPELTFVHEAGHVLYHEVFGGKDGIPSQDVTGVFNAIRDSEVYEGLTYLADEGGFGVEPAYWEYAARDDEFFSRAYAQYITVKSGSPKLLAQLKAQQNQFTSEYWGDDDFEPIRKAFDELFAKKGWI